MLGEQHDVQYVLAQGEGAVCRAGPVPRLRVGADDSGGRGKTMSAVDADRMRLWPSILG
jgi:hypothetical protein